MTKCKGKFSACSQIISVTKHQSKPNATLWIWDQYSEITSWSNECSSSSTWHTVEADHIQAVEIRRSPLIKQANICQLFVPNTLFKLRLITTTDKEKSSRCVSTHIPGHSTCWTTEGKFIRSRSDGQDGSASEQMDELYGESEAAFSLSFTQKPMQTAQWTPLACTALDNAQKLKENLFKD